MTTRNVERISETLGANLGVLIIAGGEPFTRKDLPEIARAFYKNNKLESIYLMSNGQIQQRIIPDVTRILQEMPEPQRHRRARHRRAEGRSRKHPAESPEAGTSRSTPRASFRRSRRNIRGSISRPARAS